MKSCVRDISATVALVLGFGLVLACSSSDGGGPTSNAGKGGGGAGTSNSASGTAGSGPLASAGASNGGTGGSLTLPPGTSDMAKTIMCGGAECTSASGGLVYIDPCCAGPDNDVCGVDVTYLAMTGATMGAGCQPKAQPGELDAACPASQPMMTPVGGVTVTLDPYPGCCRAETGTCGVAVDTVTALGGSLAIANVGLGCVDAAPFFPGEAPLPCEGPGVGGSGAGGDSSGASGAGGAP